MAIITVDQRLQTSKPPRVKRNAMPNPKYPDSITVQWGAFQIGMETDEAQKLVDALQAALGHAYRMRVGPGMAAEDAERLAKTIRLLGGI